MMPESCHKTTQVDIRVRSLSHLFCGFISLAQKSSEESTGSAVNPIAGAPGEQGLRNPTIYRYVRAALSLGAGLVLPQWRRAGLRAAWGRGQERHGGGAKSGGREILWGSAQFGAILEGGERLVAQAYLDWLPVVGAGLRPSDGQRRRQQARPTRRHLEWVAGLPRMRSSGFLAQETQRLKLKFKCFGARSLYFIC